MTGLPQRVLRERHPPPDGVSERRLSDERVEVPARSPPPRSCECGGAPHGCATRRARAASQRGPGLLPFTWSRRLRQQALRTPSRSQSNEVRPHDFRTVASRQRWQQLPGGSGTNGHSGRDVQDVSDSRLLPPAEESISRVEFVRSWSPGSRTLRARLNTFCTFSRAEMSFSNTPGTASRFRLTLTRRVLELLDFGAIATDRVADVVLVG